MKARTGQGSRAATVGVIVTAALLGVIPMANAVATAAERPVAAERNPPGDIPDTQVFVRYVSPLGFSLEVPEGWARTERGDGVHFADKYDAVDVAVGSGPAAPTVESVTGHDAAALVRSGRAVRIDAIKNVKLASGPAVLIAYSSNSEPNAVTGKQLRLENQRYLIYRSGRVAAIDLSAPLGADNVDQWKYIGDSFRWQ